MENLPKIKKRPTADLSPGNAGGWGGVISGTMLVIGNFRVIKGLT